MDILTPTERIQIAAIIEDVADTYFKTPFSITRTGVGGVLPERWNNATTEKGGAKNAQVFNLFGMIEYRDPSTSFFMDNVGGADGDFDIMITVSLKKAITEGVALANRKTVVRDGDSIEIANNKEKYRIVAILFDGHFDSSGQLLMFKCKRETLK